MCVCVCVCVYVSGGSGWEVNWDNKPSLTGRVAHAQCSSMCFSWWQLFVPLCWLLAFVGGWKG